MRRLGICLLLWLSLGVAHAAPPPQWLARESWPGGKQYDPRLARTVTFWGTGVPAAQAFASLTEQTGVPLGFFPPGDDNARICLNLYLNPDRPPTLRDLLVQIGWTMDCAWAVEGRGEHSRYLLLHTTISDKVLEKIQQESDAADRRRGEEESRAEADRFAAAVAKLPELRDALRLSRDAAIKRYRGNDDAMLLVLLDPARRAVAQVFTSLSEADLGQLCPSSGIVRPWEELAPEQQAAVTEAVRPALARLADEVRKGWRSPDQQWDPTSGDRDLEVMLVGEDGGFSISLTATSRQPSRPADGTSTSISAASPSAPSPTSSSSRTTSHCGDSWVSRSAMSPSQTWPVSTMPAASFSSSAPSSSSNSPPSAGSRPRPPITSARSACQWR